MTEEIKNTNYILHSLQAKVDQLEVVNKELEEKLFKQDENIEQLLAKVNFEKCGTVTFPVVNQEQEQEQLLLEKDDLETNKEDQNKLTTDKSIHNLPLVRILGKFCGCR
jgi:hypothetical protein